MILIKTHLIKPISLVLFVVIASISLSGCSDNENSRNINSDIQIEDSGNESSVVEEISTTSTLNAYDTSTPINTESTNSDTNSSSNSEPTSSSSDSTTESKPEESTSSSTTESSNSSTSKPTGSGSFTGDGDKPSSSTDTPAGNLKPTYTPSKGVREGDWIWMEDEGEWWYDPDHNYGTPEEAAARQAKYDRNHSGEGHLGEGFNPTPEELAEILANLRG